MASIPLPALSAKAPTVADPMEQYSRYLALKQALAQQKMIPGQLEAQKQANIAAQQENQARTQQLADQKAVTSAMQEWDGKDYSELPQLAVKHGASANTVMSLRNSITKHQQELTTLDKDQLANEKVKNDYFAQSIENIEGLPADQQPNAFEAAKTSAVQKGYLDPQTAQGLQYQSPQQLDMLKKSLLGHSAALADAEKRVSIATQEAALPGVQATSAQKELSVNATKLATATTQEQYSKMWGDLPARIAINFPQPGQWTPDSKQAILSAGMTPHEQATVPVEQQEMADWLKKPENKGKGPADFMVWKNKNSPTVIKEQIVGGETGANEPSVTDSTSQSILAQTGLSYPAFAVLTGQASQLPRDKATRAKAMWEAQKWANAKGVDVSTLASQYKSYNEVLSNNISRLNNTKIMEQELIGTTQNLQGVVKDKDLGSLKFANVAKIWAGQEVNDSLAEQYAMHLSQLRNELSAYFAATQGRSGSSITISDQHDAEQVIKNGISSGSLNGMMKAVENSTSKMDTVMQGSVDRARKAVWNLFGVGENYKSTSAPGKTTETKPSQTGGFDWNSLPKVK